MAAVSDAELRELLGFETIAVIGCSATPGKDAHEIPKYLHEHGYTVIPVNPFADEIFGQQVYDSISDVRETIDIVDVFRPSDEIAEIVDEVLERDDVKAIWTQLGIRDDDAAEKAENAGKRVVQDRCMKIEHRRLIN